MSMIQKCIPDAYHTSIFDIPYMDLKKQGIKTLFFDLDNTLMSYDTTELDQKTILFLNELKKDFSILIMSNSGYKRVSHATKMMDIDTLWHALKPTKMGFKKALKKMHASVDQTVMIGDQLMTDIYGAHRVGLKALLLKSVKRTSDRRLTKINRKIESYVLNKIKMKYPNLYESRLERYVSEHAL